MQNFDGPEPSDAFMDAISSGYGSSELTCDFCGCTHMAYQAFIDDEPDVNESWMENCDTEYNENPDSIVIHYDYEAIMGKLIDGKTWVVGCECNHIKRYEDWIWNNRDTIRRYLKVRVDQELEWAKQEHLKNVLSDFTSAG